MLQLIVILIFFWVINIILLFIIISTVNYCTVIYIFKNVSLFFVRIL